MELKDTIQMMNSDDFKERFKAEYYQVKTRYEKFDEMITKYEAGTLSFIPKCPIELLKVQKVCMSNYIYCLEVRAEIEEINLGGNDNGR